LKEQLLQTTSSIVSNRYRSISKKTNFILQNETIINEQNPNETQNRQLVSTASQLLLTPVKTNLQQKDISEQEEKENEEEQTNMNNSFGLLQTQSKTIEYLQMELLKSQNQQRIQQIRNNENKSDQKTENSENDDEYYDRNSEVPLTTENEGKSQNQPRIQQIRNPNKANQQPENRTLEVPLTIQNEGIDFYLQQIEALESTVEQLSLKLDATNKVTYATLSERQNLDSSVLTSDEAEELNELLQLMNESLKQEIKEKQQIVETLLNDVDE
jgi:hypothetical protein